MIITTQRLILRPWKESDAESLYTYAKDERIGPIAGWQVHTSVQESLEIIKNVLSADETYAVCLKDDECAIGSISLMTGSQSNLKLKDTEGEIGYWIGVPFWGQGLIPEAVHALIRHAFVDLNIETLWCGYFEGNDKSRRVQEKCGFKYDHTNKDIYWERMGDIRTEHITKLSKAQWLEQMAIRKLKQEEIPQALDLIWNVFIKYEAPDYSEEGVKEFRHCLSDEEFLKDIDYYGAFDGKDLIGVIGIRPERIHICFFFVDGQYHRLRIGTRLFNTLITDYHNKTITLNSSPYGVPFYHYLGFEDTDQEQTINGIRFTPMKY